MQELFNELNSTRSSDIAVVTNRHLKTMTPLPLKPGKQVVSKMDLKAQSESREIAAFGTNVLLANESRFKASKMRSINCCWREI